MKEYYKLVYQRKDGRFYSCQPPSWRLELVYQIGRETRPTVGKILLFHCLEDAMKFRSYFSLTRVEDPPRYVLLRGTATGVTAPPAKRLKHPFQRGSIEKTIEKFWKGELDDLPSYCWTIWPTGTVAADSFTPSGVVMPEKEEVKA